MAGGYKTVINHRTGVTTLGEPSQEQVTLLNVKDEPTTYAGMSYIVVFNILNYDTEVQYGQVQDCAVRGLGGTKGSSVYFCTCDIITMQKCYYIVQYSK